LIILLLLAEAEVAQPQEVEEAQAVTELQLALQAAAVPLNRRLL
jgi:hypothetical protein